MLFAMVFLAVVDSLSKLLAVNYPVEQITFMRNLVHAGFTGTCLIVRPGFGDMSQGMPFAFAATFRITGRRWEYF